MATLQQLHLEHYGTRNAPDDAHLAYEVLLPPAASLAASPVSAASVRAALSALLPEGPPLPVLLACGPAACAAATALLLGLPPSDRGSVVLCGEAVDGARRRGVARAREVRVWRCEVGGEGSGGAMPMLLVCAPAADGEVGMSGPWPPPSSPAQQAWLLPLLLALAPSASAIIALDARVPPRERLPLPESDAVGGALAERSSIEVAGLTLRWPGERLLPGSVTSTVGERGLPRVPLRCLPPPAHLDGCLAAVLTAACAQRELAGMPVAALRAYAPLAELGGVGVAAALAAAAQLALRAGTAVLPDDFAAVHAAAARALGSGGLASSALMS